MINVIAIGDSLTNLGFLDNGWATLIHQDNPNIQLQNFGKNGITSTETMNTLSSRINVEEIKNSQIATLLLGTNDVLHYYENPISLYQISKNLYAIISYLQSINPGLRIILIGPPISTYSINEYITEDKSLIYRVNRVVLTLAKQLNIAFVDLMDNTDGNKILEGDLYDGIHMNDSGHIKMVAKLMKHLT